MRYEPERKGRTRARIVAQAALTLRSGGPDRLGVADVMAGAGLTHGGFYAHFPSKDALVEEAMGAVFADARRRGGLDAVQSSDADDLRGAFRAYLSGYLSPLHRDQPDLGCPLPALSADMARGLKPARQRFAQGLADLTTQMAAIMARLGHADPGAQAVATVAQMAGAVALARAVGKGPQSDAILRDTFAVLCERLDV
jgi:TetR/AcrR family transcriptional repressor of nem operon